MANFMDKFNGYMFGKFSKGLGNMLLVTGTLGWVLSAVGQLWGLKTNKNLSDDQKKFLMPQEMADAVANIISFYVITKSVKDLSKKAVSSGKLVTKEIAVFCEKNGIDIAKTKDIGKAISDEIGKLKAVVNTKELHVPQVKKDDLNAKIKVLQDFNDDKYAPFEGGAETVGSVVGAIVSSNILTPILRNKFASSRQNQAKEKVRMETQLKSQALEIDSLKLKQNNTLPQKTSYANVYRPTGSMKI